MRGWRRSAHGRIAANGIGQLARKDLVESQQKRSLLSDVVEFKPHFFQQPLAEVPWRGRSMRAVKQLVLPGKVVARRPRNLPQLPSRAHKFGLDTVRHRRKCLLNAGKRCAWHQPLFRAFVIDVTHQVKRILVKPHPEMNPVFFNSIPISLISPTGTLATQTPPKGIHRNLETHQVKRILVKPHPEMNPVFFNSIPISLISPTGTLATQTPPKGIHRNLVSLLPPRLLGQLERCTEGSNSTAQNRYLLHSCLRVQPL